MSKSSAVDKSRSIVNIAITRTLFYSDETNIGYSTFPNENVQVSFRECDYVLLKI